MQLFAGNSLSLLCQVIRTHIAPLVLFNLIVLGSCAQQPRPLPSEVVHAAQQSAERSGAAAGPSTKRKTTQQEAAQVRSSRKSAEASLIEAEMSLVDTSRRLLEQKLRSLDIELYGVLTIGRPLSAALRGEQTYTREEERYLKEREARKPLTEEQERQKEAQSERASATLPEALTRYMRVDAERARLVSMLVRRLNAAQIEELRQRGVPIDRDPKITQIVERYSRP